MPLMAGIAYWMKNLRGQVPALLLKPWSAGAGIHNILFFRAPMMKSWLVVKLRNKR
ncbi:hypothetical protein SAMN05216516_10126 [Izhakiella capsodis]|uniref:Uncharacterized protein n=1 Tax=Izhakiella capsodis TaxID=1367852 RepID=A0A1I4UBK1_9GAMM|nr:hypothetical protein SAMN05216516_10126 [Izhakiella capsodis]